MTDRLKGIASAIARRWLGPGARFIVRTQLNQWREHGPVWFLRWNCMLATAWVRDRANRAAYRVIGERELKAARKSHKVFIFGSGASLNELEAADWAHFAEHDVCGFNAFYYQRWIDVDFHLLRGAVYGDLRWQPFAHEVESALGASTHFARTIFVLQAGYLAQLANQLVGYRLLPAGARLFRYRTAREDGPPTRTFGEGLRHTTGTLADAVNFAACAGWTDIVLVGVDLYDSRYFHLPPDETVVVDAETGGLTSGEWAPRGQRYDQPHATSRRGVIELMRSWRAALERDGVRLAVYNPRSLLADVIPVYQRTDA